MKTKNSIARFVKDGNNAKRIFSLLVVSSLMLGVRAADYTLQYSESASYMSSTGWRADVSGITPTSYSGTVTIPGSYKKVNETYVVCEIDQNAFKNSSLTKLYIPSSVFSIQHLGSCTSLQKIVIRLPVGSFEGPTIVANAFSGTHADCLVYVPKGYRRDGETKAVKPGDFLGGRPIEWFHYHVHFNANGGSGSMPDQTIYTDETTNLTANAYSRSGYSFAGWATSSGGAVKYANKASVKNLDTGINATVNLYAVWTANSYSVKFNANGGTGTMANEAFTYGTSKALTANAFTRAGYTFQGWATSAGGAKVYDDQQSVNNLTTTANGTVNLYAVWVGCQYAVKFNANGGIGTMVDQPFSFWVSQDLSSNAFSRVGYTFDGWATSADGTKVYSDRQCVYNLTDTANEIVNLYATWMPQTSAAITARPRYPWNGKVDVDATIGGNELRQYLVSIEAKDLDGGTNLPMSIDQCLVSPGKHRFTWEADADIAGDCELTNVAVSVNVDDGLLVSAKKVLSLEVTGYTGTETLTNVPVLVRLSEAIEGFCYNDFADANGGDLIFTDESGSMVYPHEIDEWHTNGESLVWVKLPTMVNGTKFKAAYGSSQLATFNSQFSSHDVWSGYTGVWHMNEDAGTAYDSSVYGLDALPTKGNNEFADTSEMIAYENGACGRARVNCSTMPTSDNNWMTYGNFMLVPGYDSMFLGSKFVASVWIKGRVLKNYPRIFSRKNVIEDIGGFELSINDYGKCDVRGGTSAGTAGIDVPPYSNEWIQVAFSIDGDVVHCYTNGVLSGTSSGAIAPTDDNGFPLGIGNKPNGANPSFFGQYDEIRLRGGSLSADRIKADYDMIMNSTFLGYGPVEDGKGLEILGEFPYSVRFNAYGGSGTMDDEAFTYGNAKALTANGFTKTGYTFQGWATSGDGAVIYSDGQSVSNLTITVDDVVDLYAVWTVNNYTVKFNANGGTGTMDDEAFTYGIAKALTANGFTKNGYTFQGWATSADGEKVYNDKQSVSNLTETDGAVVNLYAVWSPALYMVIDLSGGANASSYPVSYLDAVPGGSWSDTYKTTKLVLRRIEAGSFKMQGTYNVTLTKPFYIGVFEMTQRQYQLIMGTNPSYYKGDKRSVEGISYSTVRGGSDGSKWPSSSAVDASSVMGKLRARTGSAFDLPTEAQWEYACRAGTTSGYNNGGGSATDLKKLGRYVDNLNDGKGGYGEHTTVGSYLPNAWGLYDMHGNSEEWCLDWYKDGSFSDNVTDPKGPTSGSERVWRGGGWLESANSCKSSFRYHSKDGDYCTIRLALTIAN